MRRRASLLSPGPPHIFPLSFLSLRLISSPGTSRRFPPFCSLWWLFCSITYHIMEKRSYLRSRSPSPSPSPFQQKKSNKKQTQPPATPLSRRKAFPPQPRLSSRKPQSPRAPRPWRRRSCRQRCPRRLHCGSARRRRRGAQCTAPGLRQQSLPLPPAWPPL